MNTITKRLCKGCFEIIPKDQQCCSMCVEAIAAAELETLEKEKQELRNAWVDKKMLEEVEYE